MKGLLADINVVGQVAYLVKLMHAEAWVEFWNDLGLVLYRFEDIGLPTTAKDVEIWQRCQSHQLILITDNRNSWTSSRRLVMQHHAPQFLAKIVRY